MNDYAYSWQKMPQGYAEFSNKFNSLKKAGHFEELKGEYLKRKNNNSNNNLHSRDILIQTVNDLYYQKSLPENITKIFSRL